MEEMQSNIDILWIIIAAALVMFMQAGFTALESGLTRAKNSINVAMKNITDFILSVLIFFLVGYAIMFGAGNSFMGWNGFALVGHDQPADYASFVFQATFAGTAATIISGAVAERIRFTAYALVSILVCAVIYPVSGHWIWNADGWLAQKQMVDFAGSSVVHSLGGWVGLAGALVLGPRIGRFSESGANKLHSHNLVLAVVGVIILWFGWIGFNGGSLLAVGPEIAVIVANTMIAAAAGGMGCFLTSAILHQGEIQIEKLLNGVVGGLVAITAGCAVVQPVGALWLGFLGGIIVFFSEEFVLHVLKIDDPVNVVSAHGIAGAWGTIGLAFFAPAEALPLKDMWAQAWVQVLGAGSIFVWGFGTGLVIFWLLRISGFLRVTPEAEKVGLNVHEHGASSGLLQTMEAMDSIVRAYNGSGNSDLTHRIEVEIGSDAGEVADTFNRLMDAFHDSIYEIKTCANEISLAANMMDHAGQEMETENGVNTENMSVIARSVKALCDALARTRRYTDEIVNMSQHATQVAKQGTHQVDATQNVINQLKQQITHARQTIDQLVQQTAKVGGILESINSISDQTNLLALNATIEAARAGDAGRGFAVVADEVRGLSSRTQEATLEIKSVMSELAKMADSASQEMESCSRQSDQGMEQVLATSRSFEEITQHVSRIHSSSNGVVEAAIEQDAKVSEVNHGLDTLDQVQQRNSSRAKETREASSNLTRLASSLSGKLGGLKVADGY